MYIELPLLTHLYKGCMQPVCISGLKKKQTRPLSSSRKRCYYWLAERGLIRKCLPLSGFLEVTVVHFLLAENYCTVTLGTVFNNYDITYLFSGA